MQSFPAASWSGDEQLLWINGKPDDRLELGFKLGEAGSFELSGVFTTAPDFGIVDIYLDDAVLVKSLDLFRSGSDQTVGTVTHSLGTPTLEAGKHRLSIVIRGIDKDAIQNHGFGLDYLRFNKSH
jgi:hypothetical protein